MRLYRAIVGNETTLLRDGLLRGRRVVLSGSVSAELRHALARLGAEPAQADDGQADALVHDAGETFVAAGLPGALQETWSAVAQVANHSLIPRGEGGKVVLLAPRPHAGGLAPRPHAGAHAQAARAALENLARTLSTEWARYGITTTAIAPGQDSGEDSVAALVCFLLSRAGDYFSGCRFDLGAVRAPRATS